MIIDLDILKSSRFLPGPCRIQRMLFRDSIRFHRNAFRRQVLSSRGIRGTACRGKPPGGDRKFWCLDLQSASVNNAGSEITQSYHCDKSYNIKDGHCHGMQLDFGTENDPRAEHDERDPGKRHLDYDGHK